VPLEEKAPGIKFKEDGEGAINNTLNIKEYINKQLARKIMGR